MFKLMTFVLISISLTQANAGLYENIKVTDVPVVKKISYEWDWSAMAYPDMQFWPKRIYLSARADGGSDLLWTSEKTEENVALGRYDGPAVWTRLDANDQRVWGDRVLDEREDRQVASGIISLPCGVTAVNRFGLCKKNSAKQTACTNWITEYDDSGKIQRDSAVPSYEWQDPFHGHEIRVKEFTFGFGRNIDGSDNEMTYYTWGSTLGGGHQGSRGVLKRHPGLEPDFMMFGCSHNLGSRAVHNNQAQLTGCFCIQDGFGGVKQFFPKHASVYKFKYEYGFPHFPLGDIVAWGEGFYVSFAAPRNEAPSNKWKNSLDPAHRTDVGVIFVPASNKNALAYNKVKWMTQTDTKSETLVHMASYGPNKEQLLLFWAETDTVHVQTNWQQDKLDPSKTGARYLVATITPNIDSPGDISLSGSPVDIGDKVTWGELMTFTSFRNGDVGWASAWRMKQGTEPDHYYSPLQQSLKLVRILWKGAPRDETPWDPVAYIGKTYAAYPPGMNPLWDDPDPAWCRKPGRRTKVGDDQQPDGIAPGTTVSSGASQPTTCVLGCGGAATPRRRSPPRRRAPAPSPPRRRAPTPSPPRRRAPQACSGDTRDITRRRRDTDMCVCRRRSPGVIDSDSPGWDCNNDKVEEVKATCDSFTACPNTHINKGSTVTCSGDCNTGTCCQAKATCDSFKSCPSTHTNKGKTAQCSGAASSTCNTGTCCQAKATCDSFKSCPATHTNKGKTARCSGAASSTCNTGTCCRAKATCDSFKSCPTTHTNKGKTAHCSGAASSSCNAGTCCKAPEDKATCDSFKSCGGDKPMNKGQTVECSGAATSTCNKNICCEAKATCDSFKICSADTPINKGGSVKCSGAATSSCSENTCCEAKATCDSFKTCSADTPINKGQTVECSGAATSTCNTNTCCEAKATCDSFKTCSADTPINKGGSVKCSGAASTCNANTCCEAKATCDSFKTCSADTPINKGTSVKCSGAASTCDVSSCCKPSQGKATCDSFNSCSGDSPINKGSGVECSGAASSTCNVNTCCEAPATCADFFSCDGSNKPVNKGSSVKCLGAASTCNLDTCCMVETLQTTPPPAVGDPRLTAYRDEGSCGEMGDDYQSDWCHGLQMSERGCRSPVTTSDCESGSATLQSVRGDGESLASVNINGCGYAFFAQYRCTGGSIMTGYCRYGDNYAKHISGNAMIMKTGESGCKQKCKTTYYCTAYAFTSDNLHCDLYKGGPYTYGRGSEGGAGSTMCHILQDEDQVWMQDPEPTTTHRSRGRVVTDGATCFATSLMVPTMVALMSSLGW